MKQWCFSKSTLLFFGALFLMLQGCDKNDDSGDLDLDGFYKGAQGNADIGLLNSFWSIYEVNYDGNSAEVPVTFGNCDRDFFRFFEDGSYREYIIPDTSCIPSEQELQWTVLNGVVKLENSFKDFNEMVILELTSTKFLFRAKYDVDEDGVEDILQFLAKPYQPNEQFFYTNSIVQDENVTDKVRLNWSEYSGINTFDRYEIYVSKENCNLSQATLLATITEKGTNFFEDLDPPVLPYFCYFLKIYTDKGLLFESYASGVSAEYLVVPAVGLSEPVVQNDQIELRWNAYKGLYFSHYEVYVKNFLDGTGGIYQEQLLASITDVNTLSYVDENPPILKNPVYEIRVFNKFGKQNYYNPQVAISAREANYTPERVIDLKNIKNIAQSPTETIVYLNGELVDAYNTRIVRYNYETNTVEAVSNNETNSSQNDVLRVVTSTVGQEIMFLNYNGIMVFEPKTVQFKYMLSHLDFRDVQDFMHLGGNRFLVIDEQHAYVVQRDFSNLTVLDKQAHSLGNTSYFSLKILKINGDRYMIGHHELPESTIFSIGQNGVLTDKTLSTVPLTAKREGDTVFHEANNTIINFNENRIYNLATGNFTSFEQPYFPLALSSDQRRLTGTSNDPTWYVDINSLHKKEITTLNLNTGGLSMNQTEGYPHYIFENYLGQTISLSTYFKRENATYSYEKPDFFFEVVAP